VCALEGAVKGVREEIGAVYGGGASGGNRKVGRAPCAVPGEV
jgi:hypothetical protein